MNKKISSPQIIVIVGYSGAGKTTLATKYCQKHHLPLLSEDDFVFKMHPYTMVSRVADQEARKKGMKNLLSVLGNYMATRESVVIEGALVDGPETLLDLKSIAEGHGYVFVPIMLIADVKRRRRRKKRKKGYVIPKKLDSRLIQAAEALKYDEICTIINNTGLSEAKTLLSLEKIAKQV